MCDPSLFQIPYDHPSNRWSVLCFDLRTLVQQHTTTSLSHVKSLQLCAYMAVRNLFTSDIKYEPRTLPSEMLPVSRARARARRHPSFVPSSFAAASACVLPPPLIPLSPPPAR